MYINCSVDVNTNTILYYIRKKIRMGNFTGVIKYTEPDVENNINNPIPLHSEIMPIAAENPDNTYEVTKTRVYVYIDNELSPQDN
jgi:hypothetical protein